MKFASVAFPAILLAMTSQAHAFCQIGDTQQCTVNGKHGIAPCDPNTHQFGPCPGEVLEAKVTIDGSDMHQTIDGFGTSEDSSSYNLQHWPDSEHVMDLAFSQEKGIGLTIFRSQISPELHPDKDTWNYSDTAQVWVMTGAVNRGVTKLFGSVWSPPAWMKTNGEVACCHDDVCAKDCTLKTENYQDLAEILSHYAGEYARQNHVNIYAVSIQNEPDSE